MESRGSSWALGRRERAETIKGSEPDLGLSSGVVTYLRDSSWCQLLFGKTRCFDLIYRVRWRTKTWSDCRGTWAKKTWFKSHLCNCVPVQQLFQTTRGLNCKKKEKERPIFVATLRSTGCGIPFFCVLCQTWIRNREAILNSWRLVRLESASPAVCKKLMRGVRGFQLAAVQCCDIYLLVCFANKQQLVLFHRIAVFMANRCAV